MHILCELATFNLRHSEVPTTVKTVEKVKTNKKDPCLYGAFDPVVNKRHIYKSLQRKAEWNKHFSSSINNANTV